MTPYLKRNAQFPPFNEEKPAKDLGIVIVIPAHNEPDLIQALESLKSCLQPDCSVEIITIINQKENADPEIDRINREVFTKANAWAQQNSVDSRRFSNYFLNSFPPKVAGVGMARKAGMDEAVRRLEMAMNPAGIIACFDADAGCDPDYLIELYNNFASFRKMEACSIYFEHPTQGNEFTDEVYQGIIQYELHLRYYINAQRFAGFPFAFQTIGSSMAVRSDAYQKQGGMNKNQAGEDFYFLQKFIQLGTCFELNSTRIIPSPRPSDRVPFGTGKAISGILESPGNNLQTYNPSIFEDLKKFLTLVPELSRCRDLRAILGWSKKLPESFLIFLHNQDYINRILEIHANTGSAASFKKRFFRWFNAFMLMKYVHYARDYFHPNVGIEEVVKWLNGIHPFTGNNLSEQLREIRQLDRFQPYWTSKDD